MESSMLEKMQLLPLLQGMKLEDFHNFIYSTKLDFNQMIDGDRIVEQGERCLSLIYIMGGEFEAELHDNDAEIIVTEKSDAVPHLIEPYNMYGVKRTYERSYSFLSKGATFTMSRDSFMQKLTSFEIIRKNYINLLCNNLRKSNDAIRFDYPQEAEAKLAKLIKSYCLFPNGEKNIFVKMNQLAEMTGETRLTISKVLNKWQDRGLAELRRNCFTIKELDNLTSTSSQQ